MQTEAPAAFRWVTEKELAKMMGFSTRTLRKMRQQGVLPYYQPIGGGIRYDLDRVRRALDEFEVNPPSGLAN